jgi:protein-S-isoprenylcysteine O-methyltransferase Ste14
MSERSGAAYVAYRKRVPAIVPRLGERPMRYQA